PICELHLLGYIPQQVEFYSQFSRQAATHLSLPHSFYRLPRLIRRWTVLKSPFKYKKFQETFQRVTHRRCISIYNGNPDVVDKWIKYLNHNVPAGMGLKVVKYQYDGM
ncbi:ribosomal protein S10 domain-containing protein, partial [Paraphysoderma sedebokerense]